MYSVIALTSFIAFIDQKINIFYSKILMDKRKIRTSVVFFIEPLTGTNIILNLFSTTHSLKK